MTLARILVLGGNDLGTACALRFFHCGFEVIVVEMTRPTDLHYHRNLSGVLSSGHKRLGNISARSAADAVQNDMIEPGATSAAFIKFMIKDLQIPVIAPEEISEAETWQIDYALLCRKDLAESCRENLPDDLKWIAPVQAGAETNIHYQVSDHPQSLGQVLYPWVDIHPREVTGSKKPVSLHEISAPLDGLFTATKELNAQVNEKDEIGRINDIPILSPARGRIAGILNSGVLVQSHTIFAEIDSNPNAPDARLLPVSANAISGGMLEAVLYDLNLSTQNR